MIENLFVWLFMLTVGLVAVWALHSGLEKLRVLLASLIWPKVSGQYQRSFISTTSRSFNTDDPSPYLFQAHADITHGFVSKVTLRQHHLHLIYHYTVANKTYVADSLGQPWNHNAIASAGDPQDNATERDNKLKQRSLKIRYNPRLPQEHLRSYAAFPYLSTLLQVSLGLLVFSGVLSGLMGDLSGLFGIKTPYFTNGPSKYLLAGPILTVLWLIWRLFGPVQNFQEAARGKRRKQQSKNKT